MGNFYVNYTLRGVEPQDVANALTARRSRVTPAHKNCVVVFDEASDSQNPNEIAGLAAKLSKKLKCPLLVVLNHDDDILWYQLYLKGKLTDEYDSTPGYFDPKAQPSAPAGGDAAKLCAAFGGDPAAIETVLRTSGHDSADYLFAVDRHAALVEALGISDYAVGTSYKSFDNDELPDGLLFDDIIDLGGAQERKPTHEELAVDPHRRNIQELFVAAAKDDADGVRKLVEKKGADPNDIGYFGQSPLHNACRCNALAAAKALLEYGANPNLRYNCDSISGGLETNRTVLMYAGSAQIVRLLLEHGADPNAADDAGYTPLMQAGKRRDLEAVELLLAAGASPTATARIGVNKFRTARGMAEAWLAIYEAQPQSEEVLAAIDKAKRVVDRLRIAEQKKVTG